MDYSLSHFTIYATGMLFYWAILLFQDALFC